MQADGHKLFTVLNFWVAGVADHHAGRFKPRRRHAGKAARRQQRAHLRAQRQLLLAHFGKAVGARLLHHVAQPHQRVGRQGGVVGVLAFFIALGNLQPLLQIAGKAAAAGGLDGLAGALAEHHHRAAGRAAPAFLRRRNQHIDAGGAHIHPQRAGRHAVQHQQRADGVRRRAQGLQIIVGQQDAAGGFDVRGKHDFGLFGVDGRHHFVDRAGCPRCLRAIALRARFANHGSGAEAQAAGIKNLAPAVAKPAIAHDQHFFVIGKLARHGFHAKGAAARHQRGAVRAINLFECAQDVLHHADKALGHVVERAVGVDHRKFKQTVGIDIGQKSGHGGSP